MKTFIKNVLDKLGQYNIKDTQFCWEYLKYRNTLKITLNIPKLMKNLIRSNKKKQMVPELEVNVIDTSTEKNLQSFFLNLAKSSAVQDQIINILIGNIEANNKKNINNELYLYYKNFFNERQHLSVHDINNF